MTTKANKTNLLQPWKIDGCTRNGLEVGVPDQIHRTVAFNPWKKHGEGFVLCVTKPNAHNYAGFKIVHCAPSPSSIPLAAAGEDGSLRPTVAPAVLGLGLFPPSLPSPLLAFVRSLVLLVHIRDVLMTPSSPSVTSTSRLLPPRSLRFTPPRDLSRERFVSKAGATQCPNPPPAMALPSLRAPLSSPHVFAAAPELSTLVIGVSSFGILKPPR